MDQRPTSVKTPQSKMAIVLQVFCVVMLILFICAISMPVILKSKKKSHMTTTTNNAKQIFYLMVEFDQDFGEFPSDETAKEIKKFGTPLAGDYSNAYFRQFIAANYTNSEEIFYSRGRGKWKKPDNDISAKEALTEGECGFAYIKGQSTSDNSGRPLVMAPMYGDGLKFNPYTFDNKAVVLRIDGSVQQLRLNKDRHAMFAKGKTLFEGALVVSGEKKNSKNLTYYTQNIHTPRNPLTNPEVTLKQVVF